MSILNKRLSKALQKDGFSMHVDFTTFASPPVHVLGVLEFDCSDNVCNRLVNF